MIGVRLSGFGTCVMGRARALVVLVVAAGCASDPEHQVPVDASPADAEVPYEGCYATGAWSDEAVEGGPFISASMYGTVNGQEVGRAQFLRLRASHEFSIDSYTADLRGPSTASSWMWHTRCANGVELDSEWQTSTMNEFFASGCANGIEALSYRVRVRAGNEAGACDPDAGVAPGG